MRQIKFRAWDGKRFHYYTSLSGLYGVLNPIECQFTGLYDKNGKEIYEGDVLRDYDGLAHLVISHPGYFSYAGSVMGCDELHQSQIQIEVIGNIYENPELV